MSDSQDEVFERLLRRVAETPRVKGVRRPVAVGSVLGGRFRVDGKLGAGGMGQVFAVFDSVRQDEVAAKMLGRLTPGSIAQIKAEFRAAESIVDDNLVRLHQLFSDGEDWFFTMDLVEGRTLPELLRRRRDDPGVATLLLEVFRQLARALHVLHSVPGAPMLHLDLKPSNFLITERPAPRVILLDFGLARPLDPTRVEETGGTPAYMAPEQARGEALTEAADWYAFGVVMYEALTGALPFGGPAPELVEHAPAALGTLCLRLLAPEPADRPSGAEVLRLLGLAAIEVVAPRVSTLVGRERELALLEAAFDRTLAGQPALISIKGPSGIGKTALVERFTESARRRGALVLTGRCRERESIGYKSVDGLIDSCIAFLNGLPLQEATALLPPEIADLIVLFPALRASSAIASLPPRRDEIPDRVRQRRLAIAAFCALLGRLRRRGPVVLWVDDLHWSDRESALLLGPLLGSGEGAPVLFIGTDWAPGGSHGALLDAMLLIRTLALPPLEEVVLGPLPAAEAEQLALQLLPPGGDAAAASARAIGAEAGGHPLFIAELAHGARRSPQAAGPGPPSTLSELVAERVAALPDTARELLEVAAIAGGPIPRGVLRRAQALGPADGEVGIDLLRANRLARSQGLLEADTVDTQHDRIREVVVQGLSEARRRRCHLRLARTLEDYPGASPSSMANHFQAAGETASAGHYWLKAADQALAALAFGNAADLYQKALAQALLSPGDRRAVVTRRAEALSYAGKGADAADVYLHAAKDSPPEEALELRRLAAEQLLLSGHLEQGMGVIEDVLGAMGMPGTRSGRSALLSMVVGRVRIRARGLPRAARPARPLARAELGRLDASWTIACSLGAIDFIRGAEFQSRHLLLALRAGDPQRLLRALTLEVAYAATPGRGSEQRTADLLAVADRLARQVDPGSGSSLLCLNRGIAAYLQGRLSEGLKHLEEAIDILVRRSVGAVWEMVTAQRFMIASLFFLGRLRRLAELVPPLLADAERSGNLYASIFFRTGYSASTWLASGKVAEARNHLERARAEWKAPDYQLPHYNLLVGDTFADLYEGDGASAHARLEAQLPAVVGAQLHRIRIVDVQMKHLRAATALQAAHAHDRRGEPARAAELREAVRRAARRLARDPLGRAVPLGCLLDAGLAGATGDRAGALAHLGRAIGEFDRQEMKLFSAAARVRLGRLRGDADGDRLIEAAHAEMRDEGVIEPARMTDMLAPGFPSG